MSDELFKNPTPQELRAASLVGIAEVLGLLRSGQLTSLDWQNAADPTERHFRLQAWQTIVVAAPFLRSDEFKAEVGIDEAELQQIYKLMRDHHEQSRKAF